MTEIVLEGLVHVYRDGDVRALDGVDLCIGQGDRIALVGQNGSGKTTLVRHLNGLLRPTAGRVLIDGLDGAERTVASLAHDVGVAFQDPDRQIFARSVRGEVEFGPRNLGLRGDRLHAAVTEALDAVGLADQADTNPYDLGTSRRKLLVTASVLAMGTPVVVLDEPTTGQDARGVERVGSIVADLATAGRTVIAISHDMRFVAETFSRVVVLRAGRVILDAPPDAAFAQEAWPALASTFLEPPYAARVGASLGLGSTPREADVVQGLRSRALP